MAERQAQGAEPWSMEPWTMDPWTRSMTSAFRLWLSFWPVAPFFGVEWRFADWAEQADPQTGETAKTVTERAASLSMAPVAAAVETATEMAEAAVASAEEAVEITEVAAAKAHEVVEAVESTAQQAVEAAPTAAPAADSAADHADDLTRIKGIGPGLARQLDELGIRNFAQIAALSEKELAGIDEKLSSIKGRCFRDDWIGQAKKLAG